MVDSTLLCPAARHKTAKQKMSIWQAHVDLIQSKIMRLEKKLQAAKKDLELIKTTLAGENQIDRNGSSTFMWHAGNITLSTNNASSNS